MFICSNGSPQPFSFPTTKPKSFSSMEEAKKYADEMRDFIRTGVSKNADYVILKEVARQKKEEKEVTTTTVVTEYNWE